MRYLVLASDYDGTLAHDGRVDWPTLDAVKRLKESGRKLLLVTGRELDELIETFPEIGVCDLVVAENGALLYNPESRQEQVLAEPPPPAFVDRLRARGVSPLGVGRVIVATWDEHRDAVLATIQELGLELQVIFNKGAVMVLPAGVNKASGLAAALAQLALSPHNTVSVGDAENDHAFLAASECAVAVSNALPALKERADLVTQGDHGAGVRELIDRLLADDLRSVETQLKHRNIQIGTRDNGEAVQIPAYGSNVLLAGTSGGGKSTLTTAFLERLHDAGYQFCAIDPEGDHRTFESALILGDGQRGPTVNEVIAVLDTPDRSVIANLIGVPFEQRPQFFANLLPRLQQLRASTGRPHWIVVDEAHHLLPHAWDPTGLTMPRDLHNLLLITLHPDRIAPAIVSEVDTVIAVGEHPDLTIGAFARTAEVEAPKLSSENLPHGEAMLWCTQRNEAPYRFQVDPCRTDRVRHSRKYAEGELTPDRSFFFRGPAGRLNLRAQNLIVFLQMMDGVDDETFLHHLKAGDYSQWFRENIKSEELARDAEALEGEAGVSTADARQRLHQMVEERYTLPA